MLALLRMLLTKTRAIRSFVLWSKTIPWICFSCAQTFPKTSKKQRHQKKDFSIITQSYFAKTGFYTGLTIFNHLRGDNQLLANFNVVIANRI